MELSEVRSFYRRSCKASFFLGILVALVVSVHVGMPAAGRYLLYLGWMLTNLYLWDFGLSEMLGKKRGIVLFCLFSMKFLWILFLVSSVYSLGLESIEKKCVFLLGLNTPFLVMFLKAVGSVLTKDSQTGVFKSENEAMKHTNNELNRD